MRVRAYTRALSKQGGMQVLLQSGAVKQSRVHWRGG